MHVFKKAERSKVRKLEISNNTKFAYDQTNHEKQIMRELIGKKIIKC